MPTNLYIYRRRLPHWRLQGSVYFVTWRCAERSPHLSKEERDVVVKALLHFDRQRYKLYAYVVMDDHVHAVVQPLAQWELDKLVHSWKSFTAHQIAKLRGISGPVWQREYFDRIMRDEDEFFEKCHYILNNPLKRWPEIKGYEWAGWMKENFE